MTTQNCRMSSPCGEYRVCHSYKPCDYAYELVGRKLCNLVNSYIPLSQHGEPKPLIRADIDALKIHREYIEGNI